MHRAEAFRLCSLTTPLYIVISFRQIQRKTFITFVFRSLVSFPNSRSLLPWFSWDFFDWLTHPASLLKVSAIIRPVRRNHHMSMAEVWAGGALPPHRALPNRSLTYQRFKLFAVSRRSVALSSYYCRSGTNKANAQNSPAAHANGSTSAN